MSVAYLLSSEFFQLSEARSGKDDPDFYDLKASGLPIQAHDIYFLYKDHLKGIQYNHVYRIYYISIPFKYI